MRITKDQLLYTLESKDRTIQEQVRIITELNTEISSLKQKLQVRGGLDDILHALANISEAAAHVVLYTTQGIKK